MRVYARAIMFFLAGFLSVPAFACDLEPWAGGGQPTARQVIERIAADKNVAFLGDMLVDKVTDEGDKVRYDMITSTQYIGDNMLSVSVTSPKGHSCFLKAKKGDTFLLKRMAGDEDVFLYDRYFFHVPEKELISYLDKKYPAEIME